MPEVISLEIDSIAAGGDGVGRSNGLVVFVPRTAPGDLVTARIAGRGSFARGTLRSVTRPSPQRVDPACRHYTRDRCGGCQIQHMAYPAQLAAKQRVIRDAIVRIGKREVAEPEVRASPDQWRYRTRLTLALRRDDAGQWVAGLHRYDDPARIFALEDCPITDSGVVAVWREVLSMSGFFPNAPALRGSVRITADGPVFMLQGGRRFSQAADFFHSLPALVALWWENDEGRRRLLHERGATTVSMGDEQGAPLPPHASFEQVNPRVAADLRTHVLALVASRNPSTIVDAYSGAGDTAVSLAEGGARVTAIELDADAAAWCAGRLPEGSRSIRGRVEEELAGVLPADAVLLNPPRAGVDAKVTAALQSSEPKPRSVVYVSCNPATLARDIARLGAYDIASVVAFDMFPQTAHVETVCELVPGGG